MAGEGPPSVRTVWRNPASAIRVLARGLLRRCPRCGQGKLFLGWFTLRERCQRCDLRLQREEGGFLGAMVINYAVTMVAWVALLVAWLVVDLPDVRVAPLLLTSFAVILLVPTLFYPFSKTIWAAVEYL